MSLMVHKRRWTLLIIIMVCMLVAGCSGWLNEYDDEDALADEEALAWEDSLDGNAVDSSDAQADNGEASCYSGEDYIDEEGICALPISCDDVDSCELWGE